MKKRIISVALVLLLALIVPFTAFAAEDAAVGLVEIQEPGAGDVHPENSPPDENRPEVLNAEVEARRVALEKKYNITIRYDTDADGAACIGTGSLAILDNTLGAITPEVVSQVSAYYQKTLGRKIMFSFVYSPFQSMGYGYDVLGSFEHTTAIIELYVPAYGKNVAMTGDSPMTIAHEFGHAFHQMAADQYGWEKLEQEWTALNGGKSYMGNFISSSYADTVFPSAYASTTMHEDFAEVFAHAFVRNKAGMGFGHLLTGGDGTKTPLGKKVDYLEKMLPKYLSNTQQAAANLQKVHTTPAVLEYQGLSLSGDYLQYIGCAYPRYILRSVSRAIGLEIADSEWIIEVGGWKVNAANGNTYLIFPGGYWERLGSYANAA